MNFAVPSQCNVLGYLFFCFFFVEFCECGSSYIKEDLIL